MRLIGEVAVETAMGQMSVDVVVEWFRRILGGIVKDAGIDDRVRETSMRLIFIYGPPAVGKLTVARELSALTGLPVFDNHLSVDCVRPVFGFETPTLGPLVEQIRHLVIGEAARQGVSLIFTFVYGHPHDIEYVEGICELIERAGGSVDFVQLMCDVAAQEERIVASRRVGRKLDSVEGLRLFKEGRDLGSAIPGREGLCIDNTRVPAAEVARMILRELGLG